MNTLRRRSSCALRTLLSVAAPALVWSTLALATVRPGWADPGSRSRTRHPSAAALAAPNFENASAPRGGKRRKSASSAHGATGSRAGGSHSASQSATGRHGRHQPQSEPADDRPAMRHADRRGRNAEPLSKARRNGRRGAEPAVVAEVDSRSRNGAYLAHLHGGHGRRSHEAYPSNSRYDSAPVVVASTPAPARTYNSAPARPYASGVAAPEGNYDDMPAATPAGGANIGTAIAIASPAAPSRPSQPLPSSVTTPVVGGFGSEVALASPDPGATRRRNHPAMIAGMPGYAPPPPANLAERNAITMTAVSPSILPDIYDHSGRLITVAPLKGSHEVLIHQNTMATADGLGRIQDDTELNRLRATGELVDFPETNGLHMNPQLPYDRRCARPWTVLFAIDLAHDFYERFHQPLYVTSAVRTVSFQMRLQRVNGNAAAIDGDAASPHLTGQALDFGKRGMNAAQLAWMRAYLLPLMESGKIDVEEEFQQACFHISVYRRYTAARGAAQVVAQMQPGNPAPINPQP